MANDYLYIGTVPSDEDCLQVGRATYEQMRAEAMYYAKALANKFPSDKITIRVKREEHDFGSYPAVIVEYNTDDPESVEQAFHIDANEPATWEELRVEPFIAGSLTNGLRTIGQ